MGSDSTISRSGRQGPPLPDTDLAQAAGSNFLSDISLEPGSTGYVESLVRLQTHAAGDDFFLDLGGTAEDVRAPLTCWSPCDIQPQAGGDIQPQAGG
jgi:hypothetical protein